MIKLLLKLSILLFSIQLTAQTSNGIISGMGKWVPIKTDFYHNNKLTDTEEVKFSEMCVPYVDFQEGGIIINKEFNSDCKEKKSEPGTYKYIGDGLYRIIQNGQYYDVEPKPNGNEMQLIMTSKDENGEDLKVVAHFKSYDSFNNNNALDTNALTVIKEYYDNGNLRYTAFRDKENRNQGEVLNYYENGKLWGKAIYKNGEKNGLDKNYYENGVLKDSVIIKDGNRIGIGKYYYKNGKLSATGDFVNGKLSGEWKKYHENGELKEIGNYSQNKKEGVWKIIDKSVNDIPGEHFETGNYKNDKKTGVWKDYAYGKLSSSGLYVNGKKNGVWEIYFLSYSKDKDISASGKYLNGEREGEWKVYFGKGLLKSTGYYQNGKKIGVWKFYANDGTLTKTETH
jgi:antitoxin component YwqK of YwqJK toxin-antitoxin module